MHELSIAMSIIDRVAEEAGSRGGLEIEAVHLRIGPLAGVDAEALRFSYEIACQGTALEGSRLAIESVPLLLRCSQCGREHAPSSTHELFCPHCVTPPQEIIRGKELELTALEFTCDNHPAHR